MSAFVLFALTTLVPSPAAAHDYRTSILVSCANGKDYYLVARAASITGDIVTGYLKRTARRGIKVRLVPMAFGYRYAGKGIWLDGVREDAVLNLSKHTSTECKVHQ